MFAGKKRKIKNDRAAGKALEKQRPAALQGVSGRPLDAQTRGFMEPRFGHDLSRVRIHTDGDAARSAEEMGADAYTVGKDIVFGGGQYRPETGEGKKLLAHELAHTLQPRGTGSPGGAVKASRPGDAAEKEAAGAGERVASGGSLSAKISAPRTADVHRQPQRRIVRADRFLPNEKQQLHQLGRGELDEIVNQVVADRSFHLIRQATVNGVTHSWKIKTEVVALSEQEQLQGASFGGATSENTVTSPDGKSVEHQEFFFLRGGQASNIESALHELIHTRIAIDKNLPDDQRSSFFQEYAGQAEMAEVLPQAKFGAQSNIGQKSSYGALPLATGLSNQAKTVLERVEALRNLFLEKEAGAAAAFDRDPQLTPAALVEFLVQEKYVIGATTQAVHHHGGLNERTARLYARAVAGKFMRQLSEASQKAFSSGTGQSLLSDRTDHLELAIKALYDQMDLQQGQAQAFQKANPNFAAELEKQNQPVFPSQPLGLDGKPVNPRKP